MKRTASPSGQDRAAPVTLISGSRGLAEHFLTGFAAAGHRLSVLVRREESVPGLQRRFPEALFHVGDVGSHENVSAWVRRTVDAFGAIDCVINNAAVTGPGGRLHEIDFSELERTVRTDLLAPLFLCHEALPHLLESGRGTIINLAGGGATGPRPYLTAYAASKCALVRVTEGLALEYPALGIYAISPGRLSTRMMQDLVDLGVGKIGKEAEHAARCLAEGGEDPQKTAALALWLFEERPAHLSGRLISSFCDDYRSPPAYPPQVGWWTLRRVDEVCLKNLSGACSDPSRVTSPREDFQPQGRTTEPPQAYLKGTSRTAKEEDEADGSRSRAE